MAHDDSHGTIVDALGIADIEERRLKYAGGKYDLVLGGSVICIYSWGSHTPLCAIHQFLQLAHVIQKCKIT